MVKRWYVLVAILLFTFAVFTAQAAPSSLTFQGRIIKSDGTALEHNNVSFVFQITDPTGACVLYQEQVNGYNMTNSGGVFDIPIGLGSRSWPAVGVFTVLDSLNNTGSLSCYGGSTYNPSIDDTRKLRVQFYDGIGWKTVSPDNVIRSVPYAGYAASASKLGTNVASDFLLKAGLPTCAVGTFLSWNGSALSCAAVAGAAGGTVTDVTSANAYISVANTTSTPLLTLNVGTVAGTVAAGDDARFTNARTPTGAAAGDLSDNYPNPTVSKIQGVAVSATAPNSGEFLKYNGTNWLPAALAISDVTNLTTALSAKVNVTQFPASCAADQALTFSSPTGTFICASIAITGAQVSGNIAGNAAGFTGSLVGDVSGTQGATSVDKIKGVPVVMTGNASGKVLTFDGTNWAPANPATSGTVTAVSSSNPYLSVATGTTTPALTVNVGTGANTVAAGDDTRIVNAIQNAGATVSIQSGLDAAIPAFGTNGRIYIATDTQKIYRDNGTSWVVIATAGGGGGTVTNVTSANGLLSISNGSSTPQITVNTGTVAGTVAAGDDARFTDSRAPSGSASGDLSANYPNPTVSKIQGVAISATAPNSGEFLKYNGTNWLPAVLAISDVTNLSTTLSGKMNHSQLPTSCAADSTLTFSSPTGSFACTTIAIAGTQVTGNITGNSAGFTGSLVGDVSGTQGATSVDKIKGVPVDMTGNGTGKVLTFDGTNWVPATPSSPGTGTVTSVTSQNSYLTVATGTSTPALTVNVGTGTNTVAAGDDTRIVNAIQNAGATVSIQSGLDAALPAFGTNGRIYIATDTQKIYRDNGTAWIVIASAGGTGGTVTSVSSANSDIAVGGTADDPVLTLNSGVGSDQILKLDNTGKIPAVDGSLITNLSSANLTGIVPVNNGGTGQSSYVDGEILIGITAGNTLAKHALSGDASMTNAGLVTVNGIKGKTVSATPTLAGQILRYDGTDWTPNFISMFDLRSTVTGATTFAAGCTAGQTLTWTAATDNLACTNISVAAATQITGTLPIANGGTGAATASQGFVFAGPETGGAGAPAFRALASTDLPSSITNALWTESGGHVSRSSGRVGIGTASPTRPLHVVGATAGQNVMILQSTSSTGWSAIDFLDRFGANMGTFGYGNTSASSFADTVYFGSVAAKPVAIMTGATERLRVDSSGNLGIGTTTPSRRFELVHTNTSNAAASETTATFSTTIAPTANLTDRRYGLAGSIATAADAHNKNYLIGLSGYAGNNSTGGTATVVAGSESWADNNAAGTTTSLVGVSAGVGVYGGTVNNAKGVWVWNEATAGTITNMYGVHIDQKNNGTSTLANRYGVFVATPTAGTPTGNDFGVYVQSTTAKNYFGGNVGIGTAAPGANLHVVGSAILAPQIMIAVDEKAAGTDGGTFSSGAWRTRTLNTVRNNEITGASLTANEITLPAGTYDIEARAPAKEVDEHQVRIYNVTGAAALLNGSSEQADSVGGNSTNSYVSGRVTLAGTTVIRVEHRCLTSGADDGFGEGGGWGTEVFTFIRIVRVQ